MSKENVVRIGIKLILITALIFLGTSLWYNRLEKMMLAEIQSKGNKKSSEKIIVTEEIVEKSVDYSVILTRNIFQVSVDGKIQEEKKELITTETLAQTSLQLSLEGTVSGIFEDARAIITDKKTKHQDMYRIGDSIQGAEIKAIERGKVVLQVNGQNEVLSLMERKKEDGAVSRSDISAKPTMLPRRPEPFVRKNTVKIVRPKRPNSQTVSEPRIFDKVLPGEFPSLENEKSESETGIDSETVTEPVEEVETPTDDVEIEGMEKQEVLEENGALDE